MSENRTSSSPLRVLVCGGTGHLGSDIVQVLRSRGHIVRVLARDPVSIDGVEVVKGDLVTGEGLFQAFEGITHVMHAATNSPIAKRGSMTLKDLFHSPDDVDVGGTRRLLEIASELSIEHFVYVSIVGLEDSSLPYSKVKLRGERLVRDSTVSWSVVRATPFFYLVHRMLAKLSRLPMWILPSSPFQPIDTSDVASHLVDCLESDRRGMQVPIGGPEITSYSHMAEAYMAAAGISRPLWSFNLPVKWARQGGIVTALDGTRGITTWATWLRREHPPVP